MFFSYFQGQNRAVTGSEHAQRDAEETEKVKMDSKRQANSDSSKDANPHGHNRQNAP